MSSDAKMKAFVAELKNQFKIIGLFLMIFWVLEILDQGFFRNNLNQFGIRPRDLVGLSGIIFAPFLHVDFGHLLANTFPFAILGWFVMLENTRHFYFVSIITALSSGIGVWLFADPGSVTMGASGVIFGYLGFLLARGYYQRNTPSIALALTVIFMYGGMIWGIFPSDPSVSWLGHLCGFLGGIYGAKYLAEK